MDEQEHRNRLLDECRTIEEGARYTAQTHFEMANGCWKKNRLVLLIIPSAVGGLVGLLTAVKILPESAGGATSAALGLIAAVAAYLGVDRDESAHKMAGNHLTALRHEARETFETLGPAMPLELLQERVARLSATYTAYCRTLETTDPESFEAARKKIKSGIHVPDFRESRLVQADTPQPQIEVRHE
jgi:bifunctional pyridoxal-dependent enzyme with beta-cystathionase and maltose regulon repressor activities